MELMGGRLYVRPGALLLLSVILLFDTGGVFAIAAMAIAVHELGHYFALRLSGLHVVRMELNGAGFMLEYAGRASYLREVFIAGAGPLASGIAAVALSFFGCRFDFPDAYLISGINAAYGVFNLLPAYPMDGGRILYAFMARYFGLDTAETALCVLTCAVVFLTLVSGAVLLILTRTNITLLCTGAWLLASYCKRGENSIKLMG